MEAFTSYILVSWQPSIGKSVCVTCSNKCIWKASWVSHSYRHRSWKWFLIGWDCRWRGDQSWKRLLELHRACQRHSNTKDFELFSIRSFRSRWSRCWFQPNPEFHSQHFTFHNWLHLHLLSLPSRFRLSWGAWPPSGVRCESIWPQWGSPLHRSSALGKAGARCCWWEIYQPISTYGAAKGPMF